MNILLFEFNRETTAAGAAKTTCAVYGANAIAESIARKWQWFFRLRERCGLSHNAHSERQTDFDEDRLNHFLHENPRQTMR